MKQHIGFCAGMVLMLGSAMSARADYVFNFNSPSLHLSNSDQSTAIATYMEGIIGCSNCVSVSQGVAVAQQYNADGNVVGPNGVALDLGNTDGATNNSGPVGSYGSDYYISNMATNPNGSGDNQLSQGIVITFTHGFSLTGTFSFDYEIFPDITCQQLNSSDCGGPASGGHFPNQPDLDFTANGGTPVSTTFWGVVPGTTNGTSVKSADSNNELAPQLIGTWSGTLTGATSLSFMDWPAAIGVDNLKLATPEPRGYALLLGGLMLAFFVGTKLRQSSAKSSN
jgi:hypothetical protein